VEALEHIYEIYLEYQYQVEALAAAGHDGSDLHVDYVMERDRVWYEYESRGGHNPPLHDSSVGGTCSPDPSSNADAGPSASGSSPGAGTQLGSAQDRPMIKFGSTGPAVVDAQRRLGIVDDGIFGKQTRKHTRQFQRDVGLDDDGIIGPLTWGALLDPYCEDPTNPTNPTTPAGDDHDVCGDDDNTIVLDDGSIHWLDPSTWCSEEAVLRGVVQTGPTSTPIEIEIYSDQTGQVYETISSVASACAVASTWKVRNVLPVQSGPSHVEVLARTEGITTATPLRVNVIARLDKQSYAEDRSHFDLSVVDFELLIESDIEYVKGWGAEVVDLGDAVDDETGGLLDGQLVWDGYRWMRRVGLGRQFWDGDAWQPLPDDFELEDSNNFAVGFYEVTDVEGPIEGWLGDDDQAFVCQYGGYWPEEFVDWNLDAPAKQQKIEQWVENIQDTWTGKFDIKREECESDEDACCRLGTRARVSFVHKEAFEDGMLVIADGNIRSNDSLFFLGEPDLDMAAHEFGHHLGNPDEYEGARVDTSLNDDGAVDGIDEDSIMGQNMTHVKKRHFSTVCTHLAAMVVEQLGKPFTFEAVPP
jgi:hypothetical protein